MKDDMRPPGASRGAAIGHMSPEAAAGGALALIVEGDIIHINIPERSLNVELEEAVLAERRARWQPKPQELTGYIKRYAQHVTSGSKGAVFAD